MTITAVFKGGPLDGKRRIVLSRHEVVSAYVYPEEFAVGTITDENAVPKTITLDTVHYRATKVITCPPFGPHEYLFELEDV